MLVGWNDQDSAPPAGLEYTYCAWVSRDGGNWVILNKQNVPQTGFAFTDHQDGTVSVSFRPGKGATYRFCLTLDVGTLRESELDTKAQSNIVTVAIPS